MPLLVLRNIDSWTRSYSSPRSTDLTFSALPPQILSWLDNRGGQQANDRDDLPLSPPQGRQSRWSAVADYRIDSLFPHNVSLNFNVCLLHDNEI